MMAALLILMALVAQESPRHPVPLESEQQEIRKTILGLFKEDYAKQTPEDRLKLSKKLLAQGLETKDDVVGRYVLLKESADLATMALNGDAALRAIEELGRSFEVNAFALKTALFTALSKSARTPEDQKGAVQLGLRLADEFESADDYLAAEQTAQAATTLAKKAKELPLINRADAKVKEIAAQKSAFDRVKKALEALMKNPQDPDANLALGQFHCFVKGNWVEGLPMLVKGPEGDLKLLAGRDLATPTDATERVSLADAWWDRAAKEKGVAQRHLQERAEYWYEKSIPDLNGLPKAKAEKRLVDARLGRITVGNWIDVDGSLFGIPGKPGAPIELAGPGIGGKEVVLKNWPPGDFDGLTLHIRHLGDARGAGLVTYAPGQRSSAFKDNFGAVRMDSNNGLLERAESRLSDKGEMELTVLLREGQFAIYVDGKEIGRLTSTVDRISPLKLNALGGSISFERIRLRRKE